MGRIVGEHRPWVEVGDVFGFLRGARLCDVAYDEEGADRQQDEQQRDDPRDGHVGAWSKCVTGAARGGVSSSDGHSQSWTVSYADRVPLVSWQLTSHVPDHAGKYAECNHGQYGDDDTGYEHRSRRHILAAYGREQVRQRAQV